MTEENQTQPSTSSADQPLDTSMNHQNQVPPLGGLKAPNGDVPTFPIMYPTLVPGLLFPSQQDQEPMNHGPGLYAVPVLPYMQHIPGYPPHTLIPFTYNLPTERSTPENREAGAGQGLQGEQAQQQQQVGPQRQVVVRRFQVAVHIDLLLILKLAAVVFLFNQDGSKQRLTLLIFFALIVYLYQTGALAPVIRWLSQGMRRAAQPPQPPRPQPRADNLPAGQGQGVENVGVPDGQHGEENENREVNDGNEHPREAAQVEVGNNRWWGIVKEIQMIVFGFITSLLPGFHDID